MFGFDAIAEKRIRDAMDRGEFDDLPGAGRPLELNEDPLVPPEVRMAYRVLKNAGIVPAEILQRREIADLEALVATLDPGERRLQALQKLALLRTLLGVRRAGALRGPYARKILEKLSGGCAS
jgi:hypothetical protein